MAVSSTVQCTGRPRRRAGHGCSLDIRPGTDPAPGRRRGRSAEGAGGVGGAGEVSGYPCGGAGGGVAGEVYESPAKGWGGIDGKQDGWSVRNRGGGTSSPSPSAPPPMAISPRSSARGDPGEEPGTAAPLIYARARTPLPRRGRGGGGRRSVWVSFAEGAGGGGAAEGVSGYPCEGAGGVGVPEEYGYSSTKALAG